MELGQCWQTESFRTACTKRHMKRLRKAFCRKVRSLNSGESYWKRAREAYCFFQDFVLENRSCSFTSHYVPTGSLGTFLNEHECLSSLDVN